MAEPQAKPGWVVVDDEILYCTPAMIDWWWVNMEKAYLRWCPDVHESFEWIIPPGLNAHIGALQMAGEFGLKNYIQWMDPNEAPQAIKDYLSYPHVLLCASVEEKSRRPLLYFSHQYEPTSYGTHMHTTFHGLDEFPEKIRPQIAKQLEEHSHSEIGTFKDFLPDLFKMWQAVKNPSVNRQCSLKMKRDGGRMVY